MSIRFNGQVELFCDYVDLIYAANCAIFLIFIAVCGYIDDYERFGDDSFVLHYPTFINYDVHYFDFLIMIASCEL